MVWQSVSSSNIYERSYFTTPFGSEPKKLLNLFCLFIHSYYHMPSIIAYATRLSCLYRTVLALLCIGYTTIATAQQYDTAYIDQQIARIRILKYDDPQHALRLNDTLLKVARAINNPKRISICYASFGTIYDDLGKFDSAFICYDSAMTISERSGFKKGVANIHNNKALIYLKMGRLDDALSSHLYALRYRQQMNDTAAIASSLGNIGMIYTNLKQHKKAIENFNECIRIKKLMHEPDEKLARWYNSLAIAYDDDGQDSLALIYYTTSIKISEAAKDEYNLGFAYGNLGSYYQEHKQYAQALHYMTKAYNMLKDKEEPDPLAINTCAIASLLNELGRHKEAIPYALQSLKLSTDLQSFDYRSKAHKVLAEAYALTGNGALAAENFVDALVLKDSMYNKNSAEAIAAMEAKYKNEIKEKQIKALQQENEIRQLTINANKASIAKGRYLIALLALAIIGVVVVFYITISRMKVRQELRLAQEKEAQQKEGIAAVIQAQEYERERIARELHDSVCQQLGAVRIGLQQPAGITNAALNMLDDVTKEVRNISYQMLPVTLQQYGLSPALSELVRHTFGHTAIAAVFEDLGATIPANEQLKLTLYRVAQELLSNVLKHSKAQNVNLQLYNVRNNLVLVVEDDGIGISDTTKRAGMGLLNIRTRVQQINGELTMEKSTDSGLRTVIKIPLAA
jgi:two-component system NarL family sensor kinase